MTVNNLTNVTRENTVAADILFYIGPRWLSLHQFWMFSLTQIRGQILFASCNQHYICTDRLSYWGIHLQLSASPESHLFTTYILKRMWNLSVRMFHKVSYTIHFQTVKRCLESLTVFQTAARSHLLYLDMIHCTTSKENKLFDTFALHIMDTHVNVCVTF